MSVCVNVVDARVYIKPHFKKHFRGLIMLTSIILGPTHHCAATSLVLLPWLPERTLVTTDTSGWPLHVAV